MTQAQEKQFILAAIAVQEAKGTAKWWSASKAFAATKKEIKIKVAS
tara:strand:+ start:316 stop:453 length:138 start_codon:yes stop_codon:yes gene_type:complete